MVTVSIIEDDKSYREGLEDLVNESGYFKILHSYPSAEIAFPHIASHPPEIAVVDIKLPGKNGVDLIASIKEVLPDTLCMVCSFYDDDEYVFKALKNGASGYILKDSMPKQIIESLKDLHQGGAPMSRYIAKKVISTFQKKLHPRLAELSERENEILQSVATGLLVKQVADQLHISAHTVTKHLKNIYGKLHVNNRIEAVNRLNHTGN
ncbi:MAG TPA: response regulator transcription factor [Chitinophagaceae bacterium]|nr:response regulator transcription factor [Chitinophagaceae bacterium]